MDKDLKDMRRSYSLKCLCKLKKNPKNTKAYFVYDGERGEWEEVNYWRICAQHYNFMLMKFMHFNILIVLIGKMQDLCSKELPVDCTSVGMRFSRPALTLTQPSIQWVLDLSRG
jgi:hypothetical protein